MHWDRIPLRVRSPSARRRGETKVRFFLFQITKQKLSIQSNVSPSRSSYPFTNRSTRRRRHTVWMSSLKDCRTSTKTVLAPSTWPSCVICSPRLVRFLYFALYTLKCFYRRAVERRGGRPAAVRSGGHAGQREHIGLCAQCYARLSASPPIAAILFILAQKCIR